MKTTHLWLLINKIQSNKKNMSKNRIDTHMLRVHLFVFSSNLCLLQRLNCEETEKECTLAIANHHAHYIFRYLSMRENSVESRRYDRTSNF